MFEVGDFEQWKLNLARSPPFHLFKPVRTSQHAHSHIFAHTLSASLSQTHSRSRSLSLALSCSRSIALSLTRSLYRSLPLILSRSLCQCIANTTKLTVFASSVSHSRSLSVCLALSLAHSFLLSMSIYRQHNEAYCVCLKCFLNQIVYHPRHLSPFTHLLPYLFGTFFLLQTHANSPTKILKSCR